VGADQLFGGAGADSLSGGADADVLQGNQGADSLSGGDGDDTLLGGQNDDRVSGDNGADLIYGDLGDDDVAGGEGADTLQGSAGADRVSGDEGADLITGDLTGDSVFGGAGDDRIRPFTSVGSAVLGLSGIGAVDGGSGRDTLDFSLARSSFAQSTFIYEAVIVRGNPDNSFTATLSYNVVRGVGTPVADPPILTALGSGVAIEAFVRTPSADLFDLSLWTQSVTVATTAGADTVFTGSADDVLIGGAGNSSLYGGGGADSLQGGAFADFLQGNQGADILSGGDGADTLEGGQGDDRVDGGAGNDLVFGRLGGDVLSGGAGDDLIIGGAGADTVSGGAGVDRFYFDAAMVGPMFDGDIVTDFDTNADFLNVGASSFAYQQMQGAAGATHIDAYTQALVALAAGVDIFAYAAAGGVYVFVDRDGSPSPEAAFLLQGIGLAGIDAGDFTS